MPTTVKRQASRRKRVSRAKPRPKFWSYEKDWAKFRGQYIASDGDRILAYGPDASVVLAQGRNFARNPILWLVPRGRML